MTACAAGAAVVAGLLLLWGLAAALAPGRPCPRCRSRQTRRVRSGRDGCEAWVCAACLHHWYLFRFRRL